MSPTARVSLLVSFGILLLGLAVFAGSILATRSSPNAPAIALGGPFKLIDQDGRPQTEAILKGQPTLLFFGYTHCPDVCPTTMFELTQAIQALGTDSNKVRVVFVSVDPERDTPAFLKSYLASFDNRFIGLTGAVEDIANVAKLWRAYYKKAPQDDGDYTIDHTAAVYVLDRNGAFQSVLNLKQTPDQVAAFLRSRI